MLNDSNKPINVAHHKKLANPSMFKQQAWDRKQFIHLAQEKLRSFDIVRNVIIEKKQRYQQFLPGFC